MNKISLESFKFEDIKQYEKQKLTVHHPNGKFDATIKEVRQLKENKNNPGRDHPFSIIFQCENGIEIGQSVVGIANDSVALENIMITPIIGLSENESSGDNFQYFESTFS